MGKKYIVYLFWTGLGRWDNLGFRWFGLGFLSVEVRCCTVAVAAGQIGGRGGLGMGIGSGIWYGLLFV